MVIRRRWLAFAIAAVLSTVAALAAAWAFEQWRQRPLAGLTSTRVFVIPAGSGLRATARILEEHGVLSHPMLFIALGRLQGASARLKAGEYAVVPGSSPQRILDQLVSGRVVLHRVTLLEGWTFAQALAAIRTHEAIVKTDAGGEPRDIAAALHRSGVSMEGRLFPDTYNFARGTTDLELLRQAVALQDAQLQRAWRERARDLPLAAASEALVLASLVEKETGVADERDLIAGVFVNRLRLGMRLQSDPTVIYGLGAAFDGNLRREDLRRDTPYNTYTRAGLPPTPIALPGAGALAAATRPAVTDALYFVASGVGDGRHRFAATLAEHNRNVARYLSALKRSGESQQ